MSGFVDVVTSAIADVLELDDTSQIEPSTRPEEDLGFDSGLFIELIMNLEERVPGLTIDPARLHRDDFRTVGRIAGFVGRQLAISRSRQ